MKKSLFCFLLASLLNSGAQAEPPGSMDSTDTLGIEELRELFIVSWTPRIEHIYGGILFYAGNTQELCHIKSQFPDSFMILDQEGGEVARIKTGALPVAPVLVKNTPQQNFIHQTRAAAKNLKEHCVDINLAPVQDTGYPKRSYDNQLEKASFYGQLFAQAMREEKIIPTFKHFPIKNPLCLPKDDKDIHIPGIRLKEHSEVMFCPDTSVTDQAPYFNPPAHSIVMISNLVYSKISPLPAVLDPYYSRLLRERYKGLVISDALWEIEPTNEVIYQALQNVDMVMVPDEQSVEDFLPYLQNKIQHHEIDKATLEQKIKRIKAVRF